MQKCEVQTQAYGKLLVDDKKETNVMLAGIYYIICLQMAALQPKNKFESQGESIQDSCKTSNDVRCRDVGREESTREEVGCGGNEDVKMDEWSHQAGQN